jgi:hypothetical protein
MTKQIFTFIFASMFGWYLHLNHEDDFHDWSVQYGLINEDIEIKDAR